MFAQWDDHEVMQQLVAGRAADARRALRKTTRTRSLLAARGAPRLPRIHADARRPRRARPRLSQDRLRAAARRVHARHAQLSRAERPRQAMAIYGPDDYFLGPEQIAWLKRELARSRATWKVIAADMPIGTSSTTDAASSTREWPPRGRELEIADLLAFIKHAGIRNTVWLTADMHYTAAHHYDPNRAVFQDFEPFWEFVSGPMHAGTWGPVPTGQHVRPAGRVPEGVEQGAGRQPRAVLRAAVLRSRRDRRRDRVHDRDAQGCRRPGAVVDHAGTEAARGSGEPAAVDRVARMIRA